MKNPASSELQSSPGGGVDRRTRTSLRAFYFFQYAALGAFFPFLPLLLESRGFSATRIALVMVLIPAFNLVIPPLWGFLADARQARLPLLRLACVGSGLTLLLMLPNFGLPLTLLAVGAISVFRAPLTSLGDAAAYGAMGGRRVDFSTVRVFGSIGFALFVLLPGHVEGPSQATIVIIATALIYLFAGAATLPLRSVETKSESPVLRQALGIARRPEAALFLVATAVYYSGHAAYDSCFSLHLRQLGASDSAIGIAWSTGVVAEILLMLAAPWFIHRAPASLFLVLCGLSATLRWALLAVAGDLTVIYAVQCLHALTFGLWYLSMVKFTQELAPDHLRTSLQSLAFATMGLGMIVGYLAGGSLLDRSGGEVMFFSAAAVALLSTLLYAIAPLTRRAPARKAGNTVDGSEGRKQ